MSCAGICIDQFIRIVMRAKWNSITLELLFKRVNEIGSQVKFAIIPNIQETQIHTFIIKMLIKLSN